MIVFLIFILAILLVECSYLKKEARTFRIWMLADRQGEIIWWRDYLLRLENADMANGTTLVRDIDDFVEGMTGFSAKTIITESKITLLKMVEDKLNYSIRRKRK